MNKPALRHLSIAVLLLGALGAEAAPFTNGSLESSAGGFIEGVGVGASANGWLVSNAGIEFVKTGFSLSGDTVGAAHDGLWMVDLNGTAGPGRISQTFDTTPGQWYAIDFWMTGNAGPNGSTAADGSKSLEVWWNGALASAATYLHLPGDAWNNLRWEGHTLTVLAVGPNSTLEFRSTSTFYPAAGAVLDDISITAVPEPLPLTLWAAGLATIAGLRRRRDA